MTQKDREVTDISEWVYKNDHRQFYETEIGHNLGAIMRLRKMKNRKKLRVIISIAGFAVLAVFGWYIWGMHQMRKIPKLSFQDALEYTTKNNEDAIISVGIIKDGQAAYTLYGENGKELPAKMHTYEIGSLTKTFTAAMISKAIQEGKIDINDTIDKYLPLAEGKNYPDIEELLTHTSGYKAYYFENPMSSNFLYRRNDFYGITKKMVLNKASAIDLPADEHPFHYSNYGYAVLGLLLEKVYQKDYRVLMNQFIEEDLQLKNTRISDKNGDLSNYWDWKENDAYLSAGAITSDISDMLAYAKMQLEEDNYFKQCHESIKEINASTEEYKMMDINMDAIGLAWIIDKENNIIWHNGGTDNYNSYIGFNLKKGTAVVILSNLPPGYRIPATVLGVKLLKLLD